MHFECSVLHAPMQLSSAHKAHLQARRPVLLRLLHPHGSERLRQKHEHQVHGFCTWCKDDQGRVGKLAFFSKIDLQQHWEAKHEQCETCGMFLKDEEELEEHWR